MSINLEAGKKYLDAWSKEWAIIGVNPYADTYIYFGVSSTGGEAWFDKKGSASASVVFLIKEIKPKIKLEGWMNVWIDGRHAVHTEREQADESANKYRVACLDLSKYNIEFEEGEGL